MEFNLSKNQKIVMILLFFIIFLVPIFYKLDKIPLYRWDESLYAQCAFELAHTGKNLEKWNNYFFTEEPLYVSKPPMVIWSQALFMKFLGYDSLLAIRLHSAIAAILTLILLVYFSIKEFKSFFLGLLSGMVLITTHAYMGFHVVKTGDMDALLTFFTTLMTFSFYKYINYFDDNKVKNRSLVFVTIGIIGGVLTKTAAAFFFVPGMLIYALYKKRLTEILKSRSTYMAIASFILVIGGYYVIKEILNPGNLRHLWEHDLGGRFMTTVHWASHPFYFYLQYIFSANHTPWIFFVPLSIFLYFFIKEKSIKDFLVYCFICVTAYLFIISTANTKITWYMSQIYPMSALIVGMSIYYIFISLYKLISKENFMVKLSFTMIFLLTVFFNTYLDTIQNTNSIVKTESVHMGETYDIYEDCLASMRESENPVKSFTVFHEIRDSLMSWNPQLIFYQSVYNRAYGFNIDISYDPTVFKVGQVILVNKTSANNVLTKYYDFDILLNGRDSQFIKVKGRKSEAKIADVYVMPG